MGQLVSRGGVMKGPADGEFLFRGVDRDRIKRGPPMFGFFDPTKILSFRIANVVILWEQVNTAGGMWTEEQG